MCTRIVVWSALLLAGGCTQMFGLDPPSIAPPDAAPVLPDASAGLIEVAVDPIDAEDLNLTQEGSLAWAHWGLHSSEHFDHSAGSDLISNLASLPPSGFGGSWVTSSWTNGTPDPSSSATDGGVAESAGSSLQLTVAAGTDTHVLRVYVGIQKGKAQLDLRLTDDSATAPSLAASSDVYFQVLRYTIRYRAAHEGQLLTIGWTDTADYSNPISDSFAVLLSATLQ
jgi:hypothetical protein